MNKLAIISVGIVKRFHARVCARQNR